MGRLRRPSVPREPVRTVEAVVVARGAEPPRTEHESLPHDETQLPSRVVEAPRLPPPPPAAPPQLPVEPPVPEEATLVDQDDADDTWSEEEVAAQEEVAAAQMRAAPAPRVARPAAEPAIVVGPPEHYPVYEYEDFDELVPATVDMTTCTVAVWRGYRKARFYAQVFDSRGGELAVAESPPFRYRGNGMPEKTEAAAQAHRALVEHLHHAGWEPARNGASWFDLTFRRR